LGPGFALHGHLDFILQALDKFPGRGWRLIRVGMRSPVIRNRHMAIRALGAWRRSEWPPEAEPYVRKCASEEPDEKVRSSFEKLLAKVDPRE
jgi:hypothetical protein